MSIKTQFYLCPQKSKIFLRSQFGVISMTLRKSLVQPDIWSCNPFYGSFGKGLGLETLQDEVGNVLIRKPASPGMEGHKTVTMQSHLDMVPQKNSSVKHDFLTDPIDAYIDGDWVKARETTLGADNGMGAAFAMAVLADKTLTHGPLEAFLPLTKKWEWMAQSV